MEVRNDLHSVCTKPEVNMAGWARANLDSGGSVDEVFVQEADQHTTPQSSTQVVVSNYSCYYGVRIELA